MIAEQLYRNEVKRLTNIIKNSNEVHNQIIKSYEEENQQLKDRIEKAIKYMDNTFNISSMKDFFEILNNIEEILKGDKE